MSLKSLQTCLNFSFCLFLLLLLQPAAAQSDFSGAGQLLEKNKKMLGNGVVALVWKDGKIIYQKEIGAPEFNAKTQAPLAASSQWLTAALIMTFVDQGKISLDDPVVKYVPVLEKYLKGYITIRECLGHTTGIENSKSGIGKILERKKYESLEAEANAIAAKEIGNNPSKEFFYGNVGLNLASRVIEVVGKKSFDRLMQERITRPLKMRGTNFTDENGNAPNPSAGGVSTANDYINFLAMLLNKGTFEGKRILSEAAIAEMEKNQFPGLPVKYAPKAAEGFEYGMGVWIQEKDGNGNATVISCPGLFGVTAYIDRCRKYAAVIFTKTTLSEQKKDLAQQFKDAVDSEVGECK